MVPSLSVALAVMVTLAGVVYVALLAGAVMLMLGATLGAVMLMLTAVEVLVASSVSPA